MGETIVELFESRVNASGSETALRYMGEGGAWEQQSWREWWEHVERIAAGLISLGVEPGDRVCLLSNTRVEWVWADLAILMAGGVVVPVYPTALPEQCRAIIEQTGSRIVLAEDPLQLDKILEVRPHLERVEQVVYFDDSSLLDEPDERGRAVVRLADLEGDDDGSSLLEDDWLMSFDVLISRGRQELSSDSEYAARVRRGLTDDRLASIVFTSGTTGHARGVCLSHRNFVAEVEGLKRLELFGTEDRQLLMLPLAHIFAKILFIASVGYGSEIVFAGSMRTIFDDLAEIRPTFFAGVPRIFEKIYQQLHEDRHGPYEHASVTGRLRDQAFAFGRQLSRARQTDTELSLWQRAQERVYDELVFRRIREAFGGEIRFLISGGAPMPPAIAEFFLGCGILILEGYGLTETTAASTLNRPDDFRFGSVGKPVPGVDITIAEDREVLIRGDTVCIGYHRADDDPEDPLDEEGWFHTGDLGRFDRDGFLSITGRKKELIVTSGGKNVAPRFIERRIEESPLVGHAFLYGDRRNYLTALIAPDLDALRTWGAERDHPVETPEDLRELTQSEELRREIEELLDEVNRHLASYESVRKFAILEEDFSIAGGELTPTHKLRRRAIAGKYRSILDSLYSEF
jgi:long-chain acyl-CoA synthetase